MKRPQRAPRSTKRALDAASEKQQQARAAIVSSQYQRAIRLVEQGLELLEPVPASESREETRFALLLERAWALRYKGDVSALADFEEVLRDSPVASQRTEALVGIGDCHVKQGDYAAAEKAYRQSLEEAEATGDETGAVRGWKGLGSLYWRQGRIEEAIQTLTRARAALQRGRDIFELGDTLLSLGISYNYSGRFSEAIATYKEALDCFRSLGDNHGVALALSNLGEVYQELNDLETALQYHEEALDMSTEVEASTIEVDVLRNIGVDLALMGRYSEALSYLEQALTLAREREDKDVALQVVYSLGDAFLRQGRVDRAMGLAGELEAEARATHSELHLTRAKLLQGRGYLARGDRSSAQAVLQDALSNAHALPSRILLWELHAALGRASAEPEVARVHLQIAADFVEQTAEPLSDAKLRASFMNRPEVQAILRALR
jgi:tetratricopeptide (TPR) repeat protein